MENANEEIDHLKMLLAVYQEHEDSMLSALIMQIQQRLEGLKACA
jgi:hypothetical protein